MISREIEEYFIPHYFRNATDVATVVFGFQPYVALFGVAQFVIYDKLNSSIQFVIKKFFNFLKIQFGSSTCKYGKLLTIEVEVSIIVFPFVEAPETLLILYAVFPECHLVSVIKLALCRKESKEKNRE